MYSFNEFSSKKVTYLVLSCIILLAILIRILLVRPQIIFPDSALYLTLAKDLLRWDFTYDPFGREIYPLYPVLTAIFSIILRDVELSAITVSILSGSLLIIPVFLIADRFYGRRTAWVSSILTAFYPTLIKYSTEILTESLFILIFITTIVTGWYAYEKRKWYLYLMAGILCGLSYLARPVGITSIVNIAFWSIAAPLLLHKVRIKNAAVYTLISIFGFIIVFLPYASAYYSKKGYLHYPSISSLIEKPTFKDIKEQVMKTDISSENKKGIENGNYKNLLTSLIKKVSANIYGYLKLIYESLTYLLLPIIAGFLLRGSWSKEGILEESYLLSWVPVYLLIPLVASPRLDDIRLATPILPILIIWLGRGITLLIERLLMVLKGTRPDIPITTIKGFPVYITVLILITTFIPQLKDRYQKSLPSQTYQYWSSGHKEMASWMKKNIDLPSKFMVWDRKPFSAYYLDGEWKTLPRDIDENFINETSKTQTVNYVVIDSQVVSMLRPELSSLITGENYPNGLKLVYQRIFDNYKKIITVYAVTVNHSEQIKSTENDDNKSPAENYLIKGERYFSEGYLKMAKIEFNKALKIKPDLAKAHYMLGVYYFRLALFDEGLLNKAIAKFTKALNINPDMTEARSYLRVIQERDKFFSQNDG